MFQTFLIFCTQNGFNYSLFRRFWEYYWMQMVKNGVLSHSILNAATFTFTGSIPIYSIYEMLKANPQNETNKNGVCVMCSTTIRYVQTMLLQLERFNHITLATCSQQCNCIGKKRLQQTKTRQDW